jgi:hypothetical protein
MRTQIGTYFRRAARALAGMAVGLVVGVALTLALVTGRARFQQEYVETADDLSGPLASPAIVSGLAGAALGWSGSGVAALAAGSLVGGGAGALIGWAVGSAVSNADADRWAGGTIGAGLGALAGALVLVIPLIARRRAARTTALLALLMLLACADDVPEPERVPSAPPIDTDDVEAVIFLAGDAGAARYERSPILPVIRSAVESWAGAIGRDSAVVVLMLGDNVYPVGMRPVDSGQFEEDSARVADQIALVRGPAARRYGARMYFVAGNHDWGMKQAREGMRRIRNLGEFVTRMRTRGVAVELLPAAGSGMPEAIDAGRLRIVLLDTAWWVFGAEPELRDAVLDRLAELLVTEDRPVVVAAHHPLVTAGQHGGLAPVWDYFGIRYLLSRSGAILQDIESQPYRELLRGLERIFAAGPRPLLFAGGHDHSLQVIRHQSESEPRYSVVSGAASKVSSVGWTPGMLFRGSAPGYMQLVVRRSGAVDLFVVAAPERFLSCPSADDARLRCMEEGVAAYRTVFSMRLANGPQP